LPAPAAGTLRADSLDIVVFAAQYGPDRRFPDLGKSGDLGHTEVTQGEHCP
jgi:hypothetical protein